MILAVSRIRENKKRTAERPFLIFFFESSNHLLQASIKRGYLFSQKILNGGPIQLEIVF